MFSPSVKRPLTLRPGSASKPRILFGQTDPSSTLNLRHIILVPPVAQDAIAHPTSRALIVEAMAHLVADHGADAAIVHGRVCIHDRRTAPAGWPAGKVISFHTEL
jgi:hypothetical protein